MTSEVNLVLAGASVRAAAFSALRAGLRPWCADLFADTDLKRCCYCQQVDAADYPGGLLRALAHAPAVPLMYTGALENYPETVEEMRRGRPLWGNSGDVLKKVRDPCLLAECFRKHGIPCPAVIPVGESFNTSGQWLRKPLASAGGMGIELLPVGSTDFENEKKFYLQSFVPGESCSGVYLGEKKQAQLLGVTRQLIGEPWLQAGPFRYCGSIGPVALSPTVEREFEKIGEVLAAKFGLLGLFGVDVIMREGRPWPVEVNPRYPASVEVLEYATGLMALAWHASVFDARNKARKESVSAIVGKAILFAPVGFIFPEQGPWTAELAGEVDPWQVPGYADIPEAGTRIEAGQPILTLFACGDDETECLAILKGRAKKTATLLFHL